MIFKQVKPFPAFAYGKRMNVENINVQSVADNLVDEVTFKYTLADIDGATNGDGVMTLGPDKYATWDATDRGAYEIVCDHLGLELLSNNVFKAQAE